MYVYKYNFVCFCIYIEKHKNSYPVCKLTHPISLCGGDPISANPYWILDLNLNQLLARTIYTIPCTRYTSRRRCVMDIFFCVVFRYIWGWAQYMSPASVYIYILVLLRCWFDGAGGIVNVFFPIIGHTKPVHAHNSNLFWWILFFLLSFLFSSNVISYRTVVLYRYGEIYMVICDAV